MITSFLLHPATTFVTGAVLSLGAVTLLLNSCAGPNRSAAEVAAYNSALSRSRTAGPAANTPEEKAAIARFTSLLQNIGSASYLRENTSRVYASDAYLNDTLTTKHGAAAIQAYFIKTSESLKSSTVTIDDVTRSGENHYIRWTMVVAAPALSHGEPVHSIGISQVRFNEEGKVTFHQDFWDSGQNFYGKLPVAGGIIGFIKKKLE